MVSFKFDSNFAQVVQVLLQGFQEAEKQLPAILTQAAADHVAAVKNRIQQKGQDSSGRTMRTRASKKTGEYSKAYGRLRQKKGRQTARIDFTMDGDLMRDFKVFPPEITANGVTVNAGFADKHQADIAGYLEAYFGPAFYPTQAEKEAIARGVESRVKSILK